MIKEPRDLLFWLCDADGYEIGTCFGGDDYGLTRKDVGGKWDSIPKALVAQMAEDGLLHVTPASDKYPMPECVSPTSKAFYTYWDNATKDAPWRSKDNQ